MITLPKPPSINHIYGFTSKGGFARSYITPEGKKWFIDSSQLLKDQNKEVVFPILEKVKVVVDLYTKRRQDVDNILKPILDLLAGVCLECQTKYTSRTPCQCKQNKSMIFNDVNVTDLHVRKFMVKRDEEEKVMIEVTVLKD